MALAFRVGVLAGADLALLLHLWLWDRREAQFARTLQHLQKPIEIHLTRIDGPDDEDEDVTHPSVRTVQ